MIFHAFREIITRFIKEYVNYMNSHLIIVELFYPLDLVLR